MINPFNLIFKKKRIRKFAPRNNTMKLVMGQMIESQEIQNNYLIALARLLFIKPENLMREAANVKANAEYLLKIIEDQKKETPEVKHDN